MRLLLRATVLTAVVVVGISPAWAFRSTKVDGHTDPDFVGYRPQKVLIVVMGTNTDMRQTIEQKLAERLSDYGVAATAERDMFPPTREWTPDSRIEMLAKHSVDSTLVVTAGANSQAVIPLARQTYGRSNTTGQVSSNGSFQAQTSGSATSYEVVTEKSSAEFSAVLVENGSGKAIWYGDIVTKAAGTVFVSEGGDAKASAKAVVEGLEEDGHLVKAK
jgi:hypothetical protein